MLDECIINTFHKAYFVVINSYLFFITLSYYIGGMNYEPQNEHGSKIMVIECINLFIFH